MRTPRWWRTTYVVVARASIVTTTLYSRDSRERADQLDFIPLKIPAYCSDQFYAPCYYATCFLSIPRSLASFLRSTLAARFNEAWVNANVVFRALINLCVGTLSYASVYRGYEQLHARTMHTDTQIKRAAGSRTRECYTCLHQTP